MVPNNNNSMRTHPTILPDTPATKLTGALMSVARWHCNTPPGTPLSPTDAQLLELITALSAVLATVIAACADPERERWRFETLFAALMMQG